jgi:hypothetical protein
MTTPLVLFGPIAAPASAGAIFTVGDNSIVVISQISATNISAGAATLTLWLVRKGGSRANGNIVFGASAAGQSLAAGPSAPTILSVLSGLVMVAGDALHALSDTASALNLIGSGVQ